MSYIQAFNNQLMRFLGELATTFPEIPDFQRNLNMVEMMVDVTPKLFVDQFMLHIEPYYKDIISRNENAFLNMDVKKTYDKHKIMDQELQGENTDDTNIMILLQIRNIWTNNLTESNRNAIWRNLNILLKIGALIYPDDYRYIINFAHAEITSK